MPPERRVVLKIRYPCGETERNERMRLTFDSWPEINVEKEWPKIQKMLQKLRQRENLEKHTVHYYSNSEHLELRDSSLADLPQWVDPTSQEVSVRFVPPILLNGADGAETAYDLCRCLGRGGFGVVFEVRDLTNTRLALKMSLPDENSRQSMENEIETLLGLKHPNIIRPLGHGHVKDPEDPEHGLPAFVMELGLYSVAALDTERYKKAAAKAVVKQVAPALLYLYDKGFGHMDLTPSNILVTKETDCGELHLEVKLIDAGGAGKLGKDVVTQKTKDYSSPLLFQHQVDGYGSSHCSQPPISSCQDLYSLIKTVRELAGSHFITVLDLLDDLSRAKRFGDEDAVLEGVDFQPDGSQFQTIFSLRRKAFKVDTGPSTLHLSSEFLRKSGGNRRQTHHEPGGFQQSGHFSEICVVRVDGKEEICPRECFHPSSMRLGTFARAVGRWRVCS